MFNLRNQNKVNRLSIINFKNILIGVCSFFLISVGLDKFMNFIEPPCSLMTSISPLLWKILGVLQIVGGILIWLPKFTKWVAGFFVAFMLFFTIYHLVEHTYDIAGSAFMAVLLAVIYWNPSFLDRRGK